MPEVLVRFSGPVQCTRGAAPLSLCLSGSAGTPPEHAVLAFSAAAAPDLPAAVDDALVECVAAQRYRIASGAQSWLIEARAAHLHLTVAAPFYRAIPPRPTPLMKRLLFRVLLALAASRAGFALLKRLRR